MDLAFRDHGIREAGSKINLIKFTQRPAACLLVMAGKLIFWVASRGLQQASDVYFFISYLRPCSTKTFCRISNFSVWSAPRNDCEFSEVLFDDQQFATGSL